MRINRSLNITIMAFAFMALGLVVAASQVHAAQDVIEEYEESVDDALKLTVEDGELAAGHYDDHDGHYGEIDGLPQLDFSTYTSQIFWMFAGFILLYILFAKKSIPEISSSVESRRDKIESDLNNAHDFKEQANKVHAEYEAALQAARETASETFKSTEEAIKADNNARLEAFKERANKLTQETEANIAEAKEAAMAETQSVAAEIASIAAEKIVGIETDIKQAETLVKNIGRKAA